MAGELLERPTPAPACSPKYRRLTDSDRAYILQLAKQDVPQTQIAQRIGCTQQTVSEWLRKCIDTTEAANVYLRGSSLRMAQNVVKRGRPDVQLKALQGIGVAAEVEAGRGISIIVGGQASVQVNVGIIGEKP